MNDWKIVLSILLIVIILKCVLTKKIEGLTTNTKGNLYIILEAPGFNVPELKKTNKIMDTTVAKEKFNKVIVVANAANYLKYDATTKKINYPDKSVMTDQWDHSLITSLNLPIEKWAFICCSTSEIPAHVLLENLTKNFTYIQGFLLDSEDDPTSQKKFITEFEELKKRGMPYKYGKIGAPRKNPQNDFQWDKHFSEMYTEGSPDYYEDAGGCVNLSVASNVTAFWNTITNELGKNPSVVPTVCGAGNCQENLYNNPCFDERLSPDNITKLVENNTRGGDFAIWYGTGQQYNCSPSKSCLLNNDINSCRAANNCTWSQYKKNPNTQKKGLCYGDVTSTDWGCAKNW